MKKLMLRFWLILLIFSAVALNAIAKEVDYKIGGYLYNLPIYSGISDVQKALDSTITQDQVFYDFSRIRIRPELFLGENTRMRMDYELDFNVANVKNFIPEMQGITKRQAVDMHWILAKGDYYAASHFVDLLYIKHDFDFGEITAGRQLISWGVGRVWQPTDMFLPINPSNFSKFEKDGADALTFKYFLGDFSDIEVIYNFREMWKDGNYGARLRTNYEEYDLSLMSGMFDNRIVVGGDFAGNLMKAGFRGEGVVSMNRYHMDSNYVRFVFGLDYQFTADFYGLIEYQYNGAGAKNKEDYLDLDLIGKLIRGEIQNISRNYIAVQGTYQLHPLWNLMLMNISNLNDQSGYANVLVKYNIYENMNLSLGGMYAYGADMTEYGMMPSAAYGIIEWYF
jgi:hypothetical protein